MEEHTPPAFSTQSASVQHTLAFINMQWPFVLQAYHVIRMGLGEKTASHYETPVAVN